MAFSLKSMNLKGCLFGPPSPKDFRTTFRDASVPDQVDLRQYCTAVENQGHLGSCTANATVGALEFLYKKRDGQSPDLSRLFVYYNSRRMRGTTNQDSGAYICDAMSSVLSFGACQEGIWPYNIAVFTNEPSQNAYQEAQLHEAIEYSRVDGVDGTIPALASGFPVVFGTVIPEKCYEDATKTGVMPIPSDDQIRTATGGHCMLIVGYDKPQKRFIVRNSWGTEWGDRGYCYIPFEVIQKCSRPEDFWIIGELAKPANLSVVRPGKAAARPFAAPSTVSAPTPVQTSGLADKAAKMREEIRASLDAEIDASNRRIEKILSGSTTDKKSAPGGPLRDEEECPWCNGTGEVDGEVCQHCGGTGKVNVVENRPRSGRAASTTSRVARGYRETATCPTCGGDGNCPSCSGKGTDCQRCGGTGKCPVCGGTGTVGN